MIFCQNCGAQNNDEARFCTSCGQPTARVDASSPPAWNVQSAAVALAGGPSYQTLGPPGSRYVDMWNWGAFFLCPFWLMNHRKQGLGVLCLILWFVPSINIVSLGMQIYYGIKGNAVAVASGRFRDDAQFVAVQNAWRNWSFAIFAINLFIVFVGAIIWAMTHASRFV